eukprot:6184185-Pleurochrysis_carterae.AAC.2
MSMPFNSRSKSATSAKKKLMDVALASLSSCREGLVEMNFRSLTVAAEDPASLALFESAVVVELVGLADESILGALDEVKGVVCYFALKGFDTNCAPLFFIRAAVDLLVVLG